MTRPGWRRGTGGRLPCLTIRLFANLLPAQRPSRVRGLPFLTDSWEGIGTRIRAAQRGRPSLRRRLRNRRQRPRPARPSLRNQNHPARRRETIRPSRADTNSMAEETPSLKTAGFPALRMFPRRLLLCKGRRANVLQSAGKAATNPGTYSGSMEGFGQLDACHRNRLL